MQVQKVAVDSKLLGPLPKEALNKKEEGKANESMRVARDSKHLGPLGGPW